MTSDIDGLLLACVALSRIAVNGNKKNPVGDDIPPPPGGETAAGATALFSGLM